MCAFSPAFVAAACQPGSGVVGLCAVDHTVDAAEPFELSKRFPHGMHLGTCKFVDLRWTVGGLLALQVRR